MSSKENDLAAAIKRLMAALGEEDIPEDRIDPWGLFTRSERPLVGWIGPPFNREFSSKAFSEANFTSEVIRSIADGLESTDPEEAARCQWLWERWWEDAIETHGRTGKRDQVDCLLRQGRAVPSSAAQWLDDPKRPPGRPRKNAYSPEAVVAVVRFAILSGYPYSSVSGDSENKAFCAAGGLLGIGPDSVRRLYKKVTKTRRDQIKARVQQLFAQGSLLVDFEYWANDE